MGMGKPNNGIRFYLLLTYHVIQRMRSDNFTYKYGPVYISGTIIHILYTYWTLQLIVIAWQNTS